MNLHRTLRETNYRSMIPFYVLYDLDLNANHIRLYCQIEQMESNPNPNVFPAFSYAWLASQLGINKRNARKCAEALKQKGYIERYKISQNCWGWRTVKAKVKEVENQVPNGLEDNSLDKKAGSLSDQGVGSLSDPTGGVSERPPNILKEIKSKKDNNNGLRASPGGSPASSKKESAKLFMFALIAVYHQVFPNNPRHNTQVLSTELEKVLSNTIKRWPEVSGGKKCTEESFRNYLEHLKENAPDFALKEYKTSGGRWRKNNLVNLARFNTIVKHTEGFYS